MDQEKNNDHIKAYFKFLRTATWVEQKVKDALKPFELTHAQLNILFALERKDPEPMSPNEIKENLIVGSPDMTRLIDRLYKKGLVERATCPTNRRKVDISITAQGKKTLKQAHHAAKRNVGNFFAEQITGAEARELSQILDKMKV